jgi:hypothetical protein
LAPHCEVSVTVLLALLVVAEPLGDPLLLLPHPAAAVTAITAASAAAPRARVFPPPRFAPAPTLGACSRVFTNPTSWWCGQEPNPGAKRADTTSTYDNI